MPLIARLLGATAAVFARTGIVRKRFASWCRSGTWA
jgi:hypothetical protein